LSTAMYLATVFWSTLVQLKFFTKAAPVVPDPANFLLTILSRSYGW
jgi:hypothetical protein